MLVRFAGFDVVTIANNHMNDFGSKGATYTAEVLKKAGIEYFGINYGKFNSTQVSSSSLPTDNNQINGDTSTSIFFWQLKRGCTTIPLFPIVMFALLSELTSVTNNKNAKPVWRVWPYFLEFGARYEYLPGIMIVLLLACEVQLCFYRNDSFPAPETNYEEKYSSSVQKNSEIYRRYPYFFISRMLNRTVGQVMIVNHVTRELNPTLNRDGDLNLPSCTVR